MIQWENIKVSDFKRNSNQTIDLGLILDSTGRITMLFKHSPYSMVCLIIENVCLVFFLKEEFRPLNSHIINTQYMTNSTLVCPVKIEYVTKNNSFGLKIMVKSGVGKIFF